MTPDWLQDWLFASLAFVLCPFVTWCVGYAMGAWEQRKIDLRTMRGLR